MLVLTAIAVPLLLVHQTLYGGAGLLADLLVILFGRPPGGREKAEREAALREARERYEVADLAWQRLCATDNFVSIVAHLASLRDTLLQQEVTFGRDVAAAKRAAFEDAKRQHNDKYF